MPTAKTIQFHQSILDSFGVSTEQVTDARNDAMDEWIAYFRNQSNKTSLADHLSALDSCIASLAECTMDSHIEQMEDLHFSFQTPSDEEFEQLVRSFAAIVRSRC